MSPAPGSPATLNPLSDAAQSTLLLIDWQQRLFQAMPADAGSNALRQTRLLTKVASLLGVPVIATRQYPQGLGPIVDALLTELPPDAPVADKTAFSCLACAPVQQALIAGRRPQVVLAGMETHVCVLQTAHDLIAHGYQVFVATDAVCSRAPSNIAQGLSRIGAMGATLTNAESVVFEWLRDAQHPQFRAVSALLR